MRDQPDGVVSWPVAGEVETLVRLVQAGLVHAEAGQVRLTPAAKQQAGGLEHFTDGPPPNVLSIDLGEVARSISTLWPASTGPAVPDERRRHELLAADADRDAAVHLLADGLVQGRLSPAEFDDRTNRALAARTYGDLDDVLRGLGGLPRARVPTHPLRKAVFWLVGVLSSPFLLVGSVLLAFGADTGDVVVSLVLVVMLLPGLLALRRWAWPKV